MKKFVLAATTAAFIAGSAFYATAERAENQGDMPPKGGMMGPMDADGDGKVNKEEFMAESAKRFGEMDTNNDGSVTHEEMEAHHKVEKAKREEMKKEMDAKREEHFKKMDTNGDGSISKEEMEGGDHDGPPKHGEEGGE